MRRFDRDTGWLATFVVGTAGFVALILAVAVLAQESDWKAVDLKKGNSTTGDARILLNANAASLFKDLW